MTAPAEQKEKTAAVLFAGFLTLALGGAGVIIAALAVGVERAWNGGAVERDRAKERGRGWLENQRAWLDADHQQRTARAQQRQAWLAAGGDPTTEPAGPSKAKRAGNGVRRMVASVATGLADFVQGAREGARTANEARKAGAGFRETAATRPTTVCTTCKRAGVPVEKNQLCADCLARIEEKPPAAAIEQACRNCRTPGPVGYDGVCGSCKKPTAAQVAVTPDRLDGAARQVFPVAQPAAPQSRSPKPTSDERATMTATAQPAAPQTATESNATVLRVKLLTTKTTLSKIADLTDQLARERTTLDGQVREAGEFATATGQSAQARIALDESNAVSAAMGGHLGEFSQGAISAEQQVQQAADGLKVAENAEDALRSAGADGRAVAPAGAAA